jgi:hypothetical protein
MATKYQETGGWGGIFLSGLTALAGIATDNDYAVGAAGGAASQYQDYYQKFNDSMIEESRNERLAEAQFMRQKNLATFTHELGAEDRERTYGFQDRQIKATERNTDSIIESREASIKDAEAGRGLQQQQIDLQGDQLDIMRQGQEYDKDYKEKSLGIQSQSLGIHRMEAMSRANLVSAQIQEMKDLKGERAADRLLKQELNSVAMEHTKAITEGLNLSNKEAKNLQDPAYRRELMREGVDLQVHQMELLKKFEKDFNKRDIVELEATLRESNMPESYINIIKISKLTGINFLSSLTKGKPVSGESLEKVYSKAVDLYKDSQAYTDTVENPELGEAQAMVNAQKAGFLAANLFAQQFGQAQIDLFEEPKPNQNPGPNTQQGFNVKNIAQDLKVGAVTVGELKASAGSDPVKLKVIREAMRIAGIPEPGEIPEDMEAVPSHQALRGPLGVGSQSLQDRVLQ